METYFYCGGSAIALFGIIVWVFNDYEKAERHGTIMSLIGIAVVAIGGVIDFFSA